MRECGDNSEILVASFEAFFSRSNSAPHPTRQRWTLVPGWSSATALFRMQSIYLHHHRFHLVICKARLPWFTPFSVFWRSVAMLWLVWSSFITWALPLWPIFSLLISPWPICSSGCFAFRSFWSLTFFFSTGPSVYSCVNSPRSLNRSSSSVLFTRWSPCRSIVTSRSSIHCIRNWLESSVIWPLLFSGCSPFCSVVRSSSRCTFDTPVSLETRMDPCKRRRHSVNRMACLRHCKRFTTLRHWRWSIWFLCVSCRSFTFVSAGNWVAVKRLAKLIRSAMPRSRNPNRKWSRCVSSSWSCSASAGCPCSCTRTFYVLISLRSSSNSTFLTSTWLFIWWPWAIPVSIHSSTAWCHRSFAPVTRTTLVCCSPAVTRSTIGGNPKSISTKRPFSPRPFVARDIPRRCCRTRVWTNHRRERPRFPRYFCLTETRPMLNVCFRRDSIDVTKTCLPVELKAHYGDSPPTEKERCQVDLWWMKFCESVAVLYRECTWFSA